MSPLTCTRCGATFELSEAMRARYPGWEPDLCRTCWGADKADQPDLLTPEQTLERYDDGPDTGVFTDGAASPNPGPGGWGAVYVVDGEIQAEDSGHDPDTTNNRMELTALIHGMGLVPEGRAATLYTDSRLCHQTVTEWAAGWERRGWKRKRGPISNLDLVKRLYYGMQERPELSIEWVPAHSGYRWNEYADALATSYRREAS